jgi:CheY-like chemotaxis protein
VAQRRFAEESLMHRSEQLRRLARELTLTEQRERQQLAYLLHDGLQQILVGAKYRLALAARSQNAPDAFNEVTELIDDAIKTSRSLTAELSPTILQQKELIPALEWLGRWMHEKHRFRLSLKAPERIPPLAEEMLLLLFQSARELLFNVVKHAGVRTARIDLDWRNSRLFMTVEDKGAGFDPNSLPFEEAKSGGIGLFNLKERLSHVGGQMEIESAPGQGSRFILSVPLPEVSAGTGRPAGEKARVSAQPSRDAEAQQAGKGNRIRVMLVDDHLVLRQGLNGMIQREPDMEVAGEASNGESAVILCREIHPDVILMDISMTGMDGIEATRIIHGEFPEVRIIGLSMFQEERTRAAMCEAGAVGYVTKSGPSETLLETIRTCAGTHPSA